MGYGPNMVIDMNVHCITSREQKNRVVTVVKTN